MTDCNYPRVCGDAVRQKRMEGLLEVLTIRFCRVSPIEVTTYPVNSIRLGLVRQSPELRLEAFGGLPQVVTRGNPLQVVPNAEAIESETDDEACDETDKEHYLLLEESTCVSLIIAWFLICCLRLTTQN